MHRLPTVLLAACAGAAFAQQPPRHAIEATGASVEHPAGWTLMPASGSPPVILFNLCEPPQAPDGCLVRGEMAMSAPNPGRETPPLAEVLNEGTESGPPGEQKPRLLKSGGFEALEMRWVDARNTARHATAGATMLIDTPRGRFECRLTMEPARIGPMLDTWRRFCASLIPVDSAPDAGTHG